jgi:hypothetical protein
MTATITYPEGLIPVVFAAYAVGVVTSLLLTALHTTCVSSDLEDAVAETVYFDLSALDGDAGHL